MRCIHPHRSLGGLSISGRSARRRGKEKDCTFGDTAASNGDDNKDVKWRSGPPRPVHLQPPHGRQVGGAVQGTVLGVNPSSPLRDSTFEIRQRDRRQRGLLACMGRWKISSSANFRTSLTVTLSLSAIPARICHLQPGCLQQRAVFGVRSDGQNSVISPVSWHRVWGKPTELQV